MQWSTDSSWGVPRSIWQSLHPFLRSPGVASSTPPRVFLASVARKWSLVTLNRTTTIRHHIADMLMESILIRQRPWVMTSGSTSFETSCQVLICFLLLLYYFNLNEAYAWLYKFPAYLVRVQISNDDGPSVATKKWLHWTILYNILLTVL